METIENELRLPHSCNVIIAVTIFRFTREEKFAGLLQCILQFLVYTMIIIRTYN